MSTGETLTRWPSKTPKSCAECRRRKVRCNWPSETAQTCSYCDAKGLICEPQRLQTPGPDITRVTTRARLANLERNQSSMWAAIRELQAQQNIQKSDELLRSEKGDSSEQSIVSHLDGVDDLDDRKDATEDISPGPTHLLQLFNNSLLDSGRPEPGHKVSTSPKRPNSPQNSQACAVLRALLPSRADMETIASYASPILDFYASLFPMVYMSTTPDGMISLYDTLQNGNDLTALASLLLHVALTVQGVPATATFPTSERLKNPSTFVKSISNTVEQYVIADDAVAGTIEGIEVALLFLRLQLGRVKVTKMWLQSRRTIALAELLGLPQAAKALGSLESGELASSTPEASRLQQKAHAWESICAIDRIISMLCSLPMTTDKYSLPDRAIVDSLGKVNSQAYLYSLAGVASRVLELEGSRCISKPRSDLFDAVMRTDHELRSLASLPGKDWWDMKSSAQEFSIDTLLQFLHKYFTVRAHLQLALAYDEHNEQYSFNFITCVKAAHELAIRYIPMRPSAPRGFFANWVTDMQAFTAVVFLQLASYRTSQTSRSETFLLEFDVKKIADLIDQVVKTMESFTSSSGGGFAQQAASVIQSLKSLLQRPQSPEPEKISVSLPLIGTIRISRRSYSTERAETGQNMPQQTVARTLSEGPLDEIHFFDTGAGIASESVPHTSDAMEFMDSISYSMEFPENYPFLADDNLSEWME